MADDGQVSFGQMLRAARRDVGWTQEALAEHSGLSARSISDLERGINRAPRRETLAMLSNALNLPPDQRRRWEQERLRLSIRSGTHALTNVAVTGKNNLPHPLTTIIGREIAIRDVSGLLRQPENRIVSITGTGGVGKTRLSIAIGHSIRAQYAHDVWFVSLASISEASVVLPAIATALDISFSNSSSSFAALIHGLRERELLLILDNLEHVASIAPSLANLLTMCPRVSMLITSRAPLRVAGEQEYPLEPFDVPGATDNLSLDQLLSFPSIALFVARAKAVKRDFRLTLENANDVLEICQRLDGLPLALELAAAQVRFLSAQAILDRLNRHLLPLRNPTQGIPDRQRTLAHTIAWSYNLLTPAGQQLFRALGVFRGGWSLEAAQALVASLGAAGRTSDDLEAFEELIDHHLVRVRELPDGIRRYSMLESIREYALEMLESVGELEGARQRHAHYIIPHVIDVESRIAGHGDQASQNRIAQVHAFWRLIDTELENLRLAFAWGLVNDPVLTLQSATEIWEYWLTHGMVSEGLGWITEALAQAQLGDVEDLRQARALDAAGTLSGWLGDLSGSLSRHEQALDIYRGLDHSEGIAWATFNLARTYSFFDNFEMARRLNEESLELAHRLGNISLIIGSTGNLGLAHRWLGDDDRALELIEHALALSRHYHRVVGIINWSAYSGDLHAYLGHIELANERLRESLQLSRKFGEKRVVADTLESLAALAIDDHPERAARLYGAAATLREMTQYPMTDLDSAKYKQNVAALRTLLGDVGFNTERNIGQWMSLEDAIAYALADVPDA